MCHWYFMLGCINARPLAADGKHRHSGGLIFKKAMHIVMLKNIKNTAKHSAYR